MEKLELIAIIENKNLMYLTFDKLVEKLSAMLSKDKTDVQISVKSLLEDGDLMYDENKRLFLTKSRGYIKCTLSANKKGYAFGELIDNPDKKPDIFIPKNYLCGALDEDNVLVEITNTQGDSYEGKVVQVLKRNTEYVVGELKLTSNRLYVVPDSDKFPVVRVNSADKLGASLGDKVVAKIVFDENGNVARGVITECLGKAGTVAAEEMSIIRSYKIRDKFPDAVINESNQIPEEVRPKDKEKRVDFSELNTITIDGEDSRDFDDAISVEVTDKGYKVGVHIADVSHYVREGSSIDKEAFLRGNSVYFPDLVIPMLPEKLSNGICSLREGVERLTLSAMVELNKDCKVISGEVVKSFIKSKHRMTYTKIQKMLTGDAETIEEYKDIYQDVLLYQSISNKLKDLRRARGEIRLDVPEPKVYEDENGEIDRIEKEVQDESHELIESLMIMANEMVAEKYFSKKLPFVYRIHEKPDTSKVTNLVNVFAGLGINANIDVEDPTTFDYQKLVEAIDGDSRQPTLMTLILRSMMKACYSEKCLGHFGIASTFYCHYTSPIRRYPDLMIHRIIKHYIDGDDVKSLHLQFDEVVKSTSTQASLTEKRGDEVERAVDDYKKALYMQKHLGEVYTGIISGVHDFGLFVQLDNTIEGLLRFEYLPIDSYDFDDKMQVLKGSRHCFKMGDSIDVFCVNADTRQRKIDFDIAERLNSTTLEEILAQRNKFKNDKQTNYVQPKKDKTNKGPRKPKNGKTEKLKKSPKGRGKNQFFGHKKRDKDAYSRKNRHSDYEY